MSDWNLIAAARGLNLPDADLLRIQPSLDVLESELHRLTENLPDRLEPAVILSESAVRGE